MDGNQDLGPGGTWGRVQGVGSDHWVLEVNAEVDSIRAQRGRARSALFTRVSFKIHRLGGEKKPLRKSRWRPDLRVPTLMCTSIWDAGFVYTMQSTKSSAVEKLSN